MLRHFFLRLSIVLAVVCHAGLHLSAQPDFSLAVDASSPAVTASSVRLYQGVRYRLSVSGSGAIGTLGDGLTGVCDARFFRNPLGGLDSLRLPIEDNGPAVRQFLCGPPRTDAACKVMLVMNVGADGVQRALPVSQQYDDVYDYRFLPSDDVLSPTAQYRRVVQGAGLPLQAIFFERLGENSNVQYNDNRTAGQPTRFFVDIGRVDPEMVWATPGAPPAAVWPVVPAVQEQYAFPRVSTVGEVRSVTERRVIRALHAPLFIASISVKNAPPGFALTVSDGLPPAQSRTIDAGDSLVLEAVYQPLSAGVFTASVEVATNDPGLKPAGGSFVFEWVMTLVSTAGAIEFQHPDPIDFGITDVGIPVAQAARLFSVGSEPAVGTLSGLDPPFSFVGSSQVDIISGNGNNISLRFTPAAVGLFRDTLVVSGPELPTYRIPLVGFARGLAAEILADTNDVLADTVYIGETALGTNIYADFWVRNTGTDTLVIPNQVIPYVIIRDPGSGFGSEEFDIFGVISRRMPSGLHAFTIEFTPSRTLSREPFGRRVAHLDLSVRAAADTSVVVAERRLVLVADKRPLYVHLDSSLLDLGDIWVGSVGYSSTALLTNYADSVAALSYSSSSADLQLSPPLPPSIDSLGVLPVRLAFVPPSEGVFTGTVRMEFTAPEGSKDTVVLGWRARGIRRLLRWSDARRATLPPVEYAMARASVAGEPDTVDIGDVLVGDNVAVAVRLAADGNADFVYKAPTITLSGSAEYVLTAIPSAGDRIRAGDSAFAFVASANPKNVGVHTALVTLYDDIRNRVPSAPESAESIGVVLRMRAVQPRLAINASALQFDTVIVAGACSGSTCRSLVLTNTGSSRLVVSSAMMPEGVTISPPPPYQIDTNRSVVVLLCFAPSTSGVLAAPAMFISDVLPQRDTSVVALLGTSVEAPSVVGALPLALRARPGTRIAVPVQVSGDYRRTRSGVVELTYDSQTLVFAGVRTLSTALEGAVVTPSQGVIPSAVNDRRLDLAFVLSDEPRASPTLLAVEFDVFVGKSISSDVEFSRLVLSDSSCVGIYRPVLSGGVVTLDSACGLAWKVSQDPQGTFLLDGPWPNPVVSSTADFRFSVAFGTQVEISLISLATGKSTPVVADYLPAGEYHLPIPQHILGSGSYVLAMKAGLFTATRHFAVTR